MLPPTEREQLRYTYQIEQRTPQVARDGWKTSRHALAARRRRRPHSATPSQSSSFQATWLVLVICVTLVGGCGSSTNVPPAIRGVTTPIATTGCRRPPPIPPGTSADETMTSDHMPRSYRLHIPAGYQTTHSQALILSFHGFSETGSQQEGYSSLSHLADQEDFLVVYPQGTNGPSGKPGWNSSGADQVAVGYNPQTHDVLFVSDLLTQLQATLCVDPRRIYATGLSNGGGMVGLLACDMARHIAAIAPIGGAFPPITEGCHPSRPISILEFHGTADPLVAYTGDSSMSCQAIPQWLQAWAQHDGCTSGPTIFIQQADVTGEHWTACQQGVEVVHYQIRGGGHTWPGAAIDRNPSYFGKTPHTISANVIMWQFFQNHPLPST